MNESRFERERKEMVELIDQRGVHSPDLLAAMMHVPRHRFVPKEAQSWAYLDMALRINRGQTISQPYMVALMTNALRLTGSERVLDVGTGSGYQAAILARLAGEVHTIDLIPELVEEAKKIIRELGLTNIHFHIGDGSRGLVERAPFDAILVAAAAPNLPQPLLDQLAEGGRLVIPVGKRHAQQLEVWQREKDEFKQNIRDKVVFVPLLGKFGWKK